MVHKIVLLFLSAFTLSPTWAAQFTCEKTQQFEYKGVQCCLVSMTQELCKRQISQLAPETLLRVQEIQKAAKQGQYQEGAYPNCHWNSMYESHVKEAIEEPKSLYAEVPDLLKRDFYEIKKQDLIKGDLVVVWFKAEMRDYSDDLHKWEWSFIGEDAAHSAIYLGDNLVFQKESTGDAVFSIDTLSEMQASYQDGYNAKPQLLRGESFLKFYRRKNSGAL